jgi:DNA modification methylase
MTYEEFLAEKVKMAPYKGFHVDDEDINHILLPHQRDAVKWACAGGRRALFEAFGLGKSVQQIEILRLCRAQSPGAVLIVVPLGVRQEFARDAKMLGVQTRFIQKDADVDLSFDGIYLTNYEPVRDGKLNPSLFVATSLDEASVLRSFGSKTYQTFLDKFKDVKYRFVATATPSPNKYKELIHYAGFLGIMDTGQALTRWFKNDLTKANNLTLYPHKEREFWLWMASWSLFLQKPSDLGYSDEGYDLPEIRVNYVEVAVDHGTAAPDRDGQGNLFRDAALGVTAASREKRHTLDERVAAAAKIVASHPGSHWILWHDLEDERRAIQKAIPEAVSIYGSQDLEEREQAVIDFSEGKFPILSAKPVIAGSGCNFQRHCYRAIYVGIGFKFNDFIQSIHRIQRFQQTEPVEIWIIYAESERVVLKALQEKWARHIKLVNEMSTIIREHGLSHAAMADILKRTIGVERIEVSGNGWIVANNDCVEEAKLIESNSIGLIVSSIPFANHYEYSPSYNDFGHTENNDHFWGQMDFLTPNLLRILKPGRIAAIHVKDRILFGNVTGAGVPTVSPFHAEAIYHFRKHGFDYLGMITVQTDVVRENNQTYRLGWTEQCKDASKMGVGSPEYIIIMHKPQSDRTKGYADERIVKSKDKYSRSRWQVDAHSFWRSSGNRSLTPDEMAELGPDRLAKLYTQYSLEHVYDYEAHVRIGEELDARNRLPSTFMALAPGSTVDYVWHDINRMNTLNGTQTRKGLENHICPLQIDIVDRLIRRYSNEDDIVFDPFGGLMTVPSRALALNRKGRASELSAPYFFDGVKHIQAAERKVEMPTWFDVEEIG